MGVIRTDKWLLKWFDNPITLCKQVVAHFKEVEPHDIYYHFTQHGMYRHPFKNGEELVQNLHNNKTWEVVHQEKQRLKEKWNGPDIPIFIFPSDPHNRDLKVNYHGLSGLAFADKLFLFVSEHNSQQEICALFTHEYNHVCWLKKLNRKEEDCTLSDTVILEGLAENAVRERYGEEYTAKWTTFYSVDQLKKLWHTIVMPNKDLPNFDRRQQDILYGFRRYPKMTGYCVGYYLVKTFMQERNVTSEELLVCDTDIFNQILNVS
ncbi:DUF2268 domain-containing protein [Bacillus piscicola]|uniref:DUF2268 domain-containing protein n=1 Tax=Bacillus piscicola TaxID=1632684 RepID=UPI001F08F303|nr:DUF2268 domain-containing protein [Bacillus piscicola]